MCHSSIHLSSLKMFSGGCKEISFFSQRFLPDLKSLRIVHIPKRMHSSSKKMFHIELVTEEDRINTTTKIAFIGSIKIAVISSKTLIGTEPSISYIHNRSLYVFPRII